MLEIAIALLSILGVWFILGFQIVRENARGLKVFLGHPYKTVESGLRWVPFLFGKILHYPTGIVELSFEKPAGFITRNGKIEENGREFGPANIGANVSFRFRWPEDLVKAVKLLPPPNDHAAVKCIFEQVVLEHVCNIGGRRIWVELARHRKDFAAAINLSLREAFDTDRSPITGNIIIDSQIQQPTVAIDRLEIPPELLTSVTSEEIAQLERLATIIRAEGERSRLQLEGEGIADAKSRLLDAIRAQPENLRIQSLLTLEQMAQGNATTIFPIPTDIVNALSDVLGKEKGLTPEQLLRTLTPTQRESALKLLTDAHKSTGQASLNPRR